VDFYNFFTDGNRNRDGEVTKFTTLRPTVSPRYLIKLKPHKQHILKSLVTVFHCSTEEWVCVWDNWSVFL